MGFRVVCPPRQQQPAPASNSDASSGFVYHDFDGNGRFDGQADDVPLQGVELFVDLNGDGKQGADEPSVVSNERGQFAFPALSPGRYVVCCLPRIPWIIVEADSPHAKSSHPPVLDGNVSPGMTQSSVLQVADDGRHLTPWFRGLTGHFLEGSVFLDRNRDRSRDSAEPGVSGAKLTVIGSNGDRAEFTTGNDGEFRIWRIPGSQRIRADLPDGFHWVTRTDKHQKPNVFSQPPPRVEFPVIRDGVDADSVDDGFENDESTQQGHGP
jgi:hypothetical protein